MRYLIVVLDLLSYLYTLRTNPYVYVCYIIIQLLAIHILISFCAQITSYSLYFTVFYCIFSICAFSNTEILRLCAHSCILGTYFHPSLTSTYLQKVLYHSFILGTYSLVMVRFSSEPRFEPEPT